MSWIGLSDAHGAEFDLKGLGAVTDRPAPRPPLGDLAVRGTIMLEANVAQFTVPRPLIGHGLGTAFRIEVAFGANDTLDFVLSVGKAVWEHRLPLSITNDLQVVRTSYSWDAQSRAGLLSVFQPRARHLAQCLVPEPRPIPWAALRGLIHDAPQMCRSGDITFIGLSTAFEPAGPMPGLDGRTLIATPNGDCPIGRVRTGDHILTPEGESVEVARAVRRTLPSRGSFAPRRLLAPYKGLARDLTVSSETLVQIEGSDVEYLLGVEAVLGHADQLGEARAPALETGEATQTYYQLLLQRTELLDAGIGLNALDMSMVARSGLSGATTLWADVAPENHVACGPAPWPLARGYEIMTINASRAT